MRPLRHLVAMPALVLASLSAASCPERPTAPPGAPMSAGKPSRTAAPGRAPAPGTADEATRWVCINFTGGRQCEQEQPPSASGLRAPDTLGGATQPVAPSAGLRLEATSLTPQNIAARLEAAGVTVLEKKREDLAVCEACGCPSYSYDLCYLIREQDLGRATRLGLIERARPR